MRRAVALGAALLLASAPVVAQAAPQPVLEPVASAAAVTPGGVQQAVRPILRSAALGRVTAVVTDLSSGRTLLDVRGDRAQIPGSAVKLATAVAALEVLGPTTRLTTSVVRSGNVLTLVGGGDPTLTRGKNAAGASLTELAAVTAQQLQPGQVVRLRYDTSAFRGSELGPGWSRALVTSGNVAPVSALMVDEGRVRPNSRTRVPDPARFAAQEFARLLRAEGVTVRSVRAGTAPAGAQQVAAVQSLPVSSLVERMLTDSSNDLAECLGHLIGARASSDPTFRGGANATEQVLRKLGIPMAGVTIVDASGLSGRNRMPATSLTAIVRVAAAQPGLSPVMSGLAVAGVSGTLADRFTKPPTKKAAGYVRAKTGTLTGVVTLSGMVQDRQGRVLLFTIMANNVSSIPAARTAVDRFATRLAQCGCDD
jgi:D-alanyl-D-alanine carboxypeptidase/D-alanyl-D-alanine-endopeptidase (penicillin-binding protein 4)